MERKVLLREYLNRWFRIDVYYLAKTLADFPLEVIQSYKRRICLLACTKQTPIIFLKK